MKLKRKIIQIRRRLNRIGASTVTEYAVIISIVSIAAVVLLSSIGKKTNDLLETMNSNMPK